MDRTSASRHQVLEILAREGVIRSTEHPRLRGAIQWMASKGQLTVVLPSIYASPASASGFATRVAALNAHDPGAVLAGTSAARLIGWSLRDETVTAYRSGGTRARRPGFRWLKGAVPPELTFTENGTHRTCASLTVLDLVPTLGAAAVDEGLRRGVPLVAMEHALDLTAQRPGNGERRRILHDSRDLPWSPAERLGHHLLRRIGLTHWATNATLTCGKFSAVVDVVHRPSRTVIEFDGWEFHSARDAFENDRWRDLQLEAEGWCVLRITWRQLVNQPDAVCDLIRRVIAGRRRRPW